MSRCSLRWRSIAISLALAFSAPSVVAEAPDDELLVGGEPPAQSAEPKPEHADVDQTAERVHAALFAENRFPSATVCRTCHPDHYREWSVSQHAYSQISPMLQAMQGIVLKVTRGTTGDFCIRCHNPVGMNLGEPLLVSTADRHPTSREGVTCVVCHRVSRNFGKISGRLAVREGDLYEPVYGPTGDAELKRVLANRDQYRVEPNRENRGRGIHADIVKFEPITTSGFCATCHDVLLPDNLRFEEAFSEWKNSHAAAAGVSCQACHMGKEPGRPSGYAIAPAASVGGVPTTPRKRTDHRFAGPDYSIIHPGLFPHNTRAQELATIAEWLTFDDKAGWGTEAFERSVRADQKFPERWRSIDDRYDARAILDENRALLDEMRDQRLAILRVGYVLGDVVVDEASAARIRFRVQIRNGITAHNVPTGFDDNRMVFLQATVRDATGRVVFRSGDTDPNGDVRDEHSTYVHNGELPLDTQLFSLRSKFIVSMVRGGEREQGAPFSISPDPLPFVRPETRPAALFGRPTISRKHKRGIPPGGERWARYELEAKSLEGTQGPYTANLKLISGMVPIHLVAAIQGAGFDFGMSPREVGKALFAGYQTLWERDVELVRR